MSSPGSPQGGSDRARLIYDGVSNIYNGLIAALVTGIIFMPIYLSLEYSLFLATTSRDIVLTMHVIGYAVAVFNIVYLVIVLYRFLYRVFNFLFIIDRAKYGIGRLGTKLMFVFNAISIALGLFLALSSDKLVMVLSA
ncbi:MAG: hypothetical protein ACP5L5_11355 [Vulcanisaeta sp.]|uniref:hypothetical protein n=1 Tax=Vulcanisaeta sp. TaxID=2020871 RepID=UPI003D0FDD61